MTIKSLLTNLQPVAAEISREANSGLATLGSVRAPKRGSFINPDG